MRPRSAALRMGALSVLDAATVELTAGDLSDIESAASQITVQGARYPEHLERLTNR